MAGKQAGTFSLGVDYGTNSCRAVIVDTANGAEIAAHVYNYPTGRHGIILDPKDPNLARQNPADYIQGFLVGAREAVRAARKHKGFSPEKVVGIGVDGTGSTPLPVDKNGTPLALLPQWKNNPAAQAWLWKDHTAHKEAALITATAQKMKRPFLAKYGGIYSSEWFWSKILHCHNTAPAVFKAAYSWVELSDFIPAFITGNTRPDRIVRNICSAGHKAMFSEDWGGLPDKAFLKKLAPGLAELRGRLFELAVPSDSLAGFLAPDVAKKIGLPAGLPVAAGSMDAHCGAVGSGVGEGALVKVMGTSTTDMMVGSMKKKIRDIPGICGMVPGSILPGMYGLEAGQSAVGDIFNWFAHYLCPEEFTKGDRHANLTKEAAKLRPGESGLVALDWNNGNRTVLVDPLLSGMLIGTTLHTTAPEIYRALIEATAFGALTIVRRFEEYGVKVKQVINCGGIAEKSPLTMQIYADVLNRPMKISRSSQTCALGAAIFGAVAGGAYKTAQDAQKKMTGVKPITYKPIARNVKIYAQLYREYLTLHDAFGKPGTGLDGVMKNLIALRNSVRKGK
jgi:L-ribulokinase